MTLNTDKRLPQLDLAVWLRLTLKNGYLKKGVNKKSSYFIFIPSSQK
jgi:hypothetical protein